jgi:hypothetical protein
MYQIERRDHLYTLPQALFFSPTIVVFSVLTLLLPLSGVFAPGSLTVTTNNSTDVGPCMIPTGYLSTPGTPDYASLYKNDSSTYSINGSAFIHPFSPSPRANGLTMKWFVEQHIPDLPQSCGPNCRYKVHVPSFVFQCTPNPSSLPYAQEGNKPFMTTLWNATNTLNASWVFYIAWQSNSPDGTSGNASCLPFFAQYDVEVRIIVFSISSSLIFYHVDSRSRQKAVLNLLRQMSRK